MMDFGNSRIGGLLKKLEEGMKKKRGIFNTLGEIPRGMMEWGELHFSWSAIRAATPPGDGHPVLLIPGFLASDAYTAPLRHCIAEKGYKVHTWEGGVNTGLSDGKAEHLRQLLENIFAENGGRKITLVGHSLGGIYARELAREYPDMVRGVITLGSPFSFGAENDGVPDILEKIYDHYNDNRALLQKVLQERGLTPPPVPTTSIYSHSDGIVEGRACLNPQAPQAENIEVRSSHLGMIVCPSAVVAVLDRLAQTEGNWKPFDKKTYSTFPFGPGQKPEDLPINPGWKADDAKSTPLFRKK